MRLKRSLACASLLLVASGCGFELRTFELPPPAVESVSPNQGSKLGGDMVTISGRGFLDGAEVLFGANHCANVNVVSGNVIECTTPTSQAGVVDVTVKNADGGESTLAEGFLFHAGPVISAVTPTGGTPEGGTLITVSGNGLFEGTSVTLGGATCADVEVLGPKALTCVTPPHSEGMVDLTVTDRAGETDTLENAYRYHPGPHIESLNPDSSPDSGGVLISIRGSGFVGDSEVTIGGELCVTDSDAPNGPGQISCYTPSHQAGRASVTVTNPDGQSDTLADGILYFEPMGIDPSDVTLAISNEAQFSGMGGVAPYVFRVDDGSGVVTADGAYTAGNASGEGAVIVADSLGNEASAVVRINPALSMIPAEAAVAPLGVVAFAAADGVPPYTFSMASGDGQIDASSGRYVAPDLVDPGSGMLTEIIEVTDAYDNRSQSTVYVVFDVFVVPTDVTLAVGNSIDLDIVSGTPPFDVLVDGALVVSSDSSRVFTFTANTVGNFVVTVNDAQGGSSQSLIAVRPALSLDAEFVDTAVGFDLPLDVSGGVLPYQFSVEGSGSVSESSGVITFIAPAVAGEAEVTVTDAFGNMASMTIFTNPLPGISPNALELTVGESEQFSISGGATPLSCTANTGNDGSFDCSGWYAAPSVPGSYGVSVVDRLGNQATASIEVYPALVISAERAATTMGHNISLNATGGVPPLSYVLSDPNVGSVSASEFVPASVGQTDIVVSDARGNTGVLTISVVPSVSISPTAIELTVGESEFFLVSDGIPPYSAATSAGGNFDVEDGDYTAPDQVGVETITVTDDLGDEVQAQVTVREALSIAVDLTQMVVGMSTAVTISGGVSGNKSFGVVPESAGNFDGTSFFALEEADVVLWVTDARGNYAEVSLYVAPPVEYVDTVDLMAVDYGYGFSATGGIGPLNYSVGDAVVATINPDTGVLTALSPGSVDVTVTDTLGNFAVHNVSVNPGLAISPDDTVVYLDESELFVATGGVPPYTFDEPNAQVSGSGSFSASVIGSTTVTVYDSWGYSVWAYVNVPQPGSNDFDFGSGAGFVLTDVADDEDWGMTVAVQPDDKIVVAGATFNGSNYSFLLVRYEADGDLDGSFGSGGKVVTAIDDLGVVVGGGSATAADSELFGVAVQPDGKILVCGYATLAGPEPALALARYDADGVLDPSFGAGGITLIDMGVGEERAFSLTRRPDGTILVAAQAIAASGYTHGYILGLTEDGFLDANFGTGGVVEVDSVWDSGLSAIWADDARVVVSGWVDTEVTIDFDFLVMGFLADGTPDPSFGEDNAQAGILLDPNYTVYDWGTEDTALTIDQDSQGNFVITGFALIDAFGDYDAAYARVDSLGLIDPGFGVDGQDNWDSGFADDYVFGAVLRPNDQVLSAGLSTISGTQDVALTRHVPWGVIDPVFGNLGGAYVADFGGEETFYDVALQSDGRIVAVGVGPGAVQDILLMRLWP